MSEGKIYFQTDMGDAVFWNGKPYHKVQADPVLCTLEDLKTLNAGDYTHISGYTFYYDDNNIKEGTNHRTWTPCDMAACCFYGERDNQISGIPYISRTNLITDYAWDDGWEAGRVLHTWPVSGGVINATKTKPQVNAQVFTAPASGIFRAIASSSSDNTYGSLYTGITFGIFVNDMFVQAVNTNNIHYSQAVRVQEGDIVSVGTVDQEVSVQYPAGQGYKAFTFSMWFNGIFLPDSY